MEQATLRSRRAHEYVCKKTPNPSMVSEQSVAKKISNPHGSSTLDSKYWNYLGYLFL
jgi:hypothetical protein